MNQKIYTKRIKLEKSFGGERLFLDKILFACIIVYNKTRKQKAKGDPYYA